VTNGTFYEFYKLLTHEYGVDTQKPSTDAFIQTFKRWQFGLSNGQDSAEATLDAIKDMTNWEKTKTSEPFES